MGTPLTTGRFFAGKKNRAAADFKILGELKSKSDARISAGVGKIDANNWFLSMTWGKGTDHLPIICQKGG